MYLFIYVFIFFIIKVNIVNARTKESLNIIDLVNKNDTLLLRVEDIHMQLRYG